MAGNKIDAFTQFIEEWLEMQEKVVQENLPVPNRVFVDPNCTHCDNTRIEPWETSAYPPEPCSVCRVGGTPRTTVSGCGRSVPQYSDPAGGVE